MISRVHPGRLVPRIVQILLFAALAQTSLAEKPTPMFEAMKARTVRFKATAMHGFEKIDITVDNLTNRAMVIDPAGSVLHPPDPALQRLGLGAPVDANPENPPSFFIHLSPRGSWSGTVWSVCLDAKKGVPPNGVPYELTAEPAEAEILKVLKYWAKNPWIDQKTVNDLIWGKPDLEVLRSQVIPTHLRKSSLHAWGGEVFWLSGSDELFRQKGEEWVSIGLNIGDVALGHGQVAAYRKGINGLRRYSVTKGDWKFLFLQGVPTVVLPGPGNTIYAIIEDRIAKLAPGCEEFVSLEQEPVSLAALSPAPINPVLVVADRETGVVRMMDESGKWRDLPGGIAKGIAASAGSIYAIFDTGIFRFHRGWRKIAAQGDALLAGRETCLIHDGARWVQFKEQSGKLTPLPALDKRMINLTLDPSTDLLLALDETGRIWSLRDNRWERFSTIPKMKDK